MFDTYHNIEDRILEAVKSLDSQRKPNIAKVACNFSIPPSRFRNCWNGWQSKNQVVAHNRTLFKVQKLVIYWYLDYLDWKGPKTQYN